VRAMSRLSALFSTVLFLAAVAFATLQAMFRPLASRTPDVLTGRTASMWFMQRRQHDRQYYVTHDQFWLMTVVGVVALAALAAALLVNWLDRRGRADLL